MDRIEHSLESVDDPRRFFHNTYARTTRAVRDEILRAGFTDNAWVERWEPPRLLFGAGPDADHAGGLGVSIAVPPGCIPSSARI